MKENQQQTTTPDTKAITGQHRPVTALGIHLSPLPAGWPKQPPTSFTTHKC